MVGRKSRQEIRSRREMAGRKKKGGEMAERKKKGGCEQSSC